MFSFALNNDHSLTPIHTFDYMLNEQLVKIREMVEKLNVN